MRKMSSDSEMSDLSEKSSNPEEGEPEEEEDEDVEIIYSQLTPFKHDFIFIPWPSRLLKMHKLRS